MLIEDIVRSKPEKVEDGILRGVKILGLESLNGRRYTSEALKGATAMYEGRAVNVDHPAKPGDRRSAYDRFGKLQAVHFREGQGLYGDLPYLKSHRLAAAVVEAAERMPDVFGLSHNADGEGHTDQGGTFAVERLTKVRSVDVVADPATTRGLYESQGSETMSDKITVKALLEDLSANKVLPAKTRKGILWLLEMEDELGKAVEPALAAELPAPEAPAADAGSADDQIKAAFRSMVMAAFDDDALDAKATAKKINEILKVQEKLMSGGAPAPAAEGKGKGKGEGDEPPPDDKKVPESRDPELDQLKAEKSARQLCEARGYQPTQVQIEALAGLKADQSRLTLIEQFKGQGKTSTGPRSRPWGLPEHNGATVKDSKSLVEAITRR